MNFDNTVIKDDSDGYYSHDSDFQGSPNYDIDVGNYKIEPMSNVPDPPYLEIVEQPADFRYRYEKEKYHGHILGVTSPQTKKKDLFKFPSVKILNYDSEVIIRCWLITADVSESSKAHFHKLARKIPKGEAKMEPHDLRATRKNGYEVSFDYLYIVHAVEKEKNDLVIYENKKRWLESGSYYSPLKSTDTVYDKHELKTLDKNQSILLFEAFDANTKEKICQSISRKIKNLHNPETAALKIVNYSKTSGSCRGGDEVFMFFEKISKDVDIVFFTTNSKGIRTWEERAIFNNQSVHHQCAVVFKTPPYKNRNISASTEVYIELFRKTDKARSESVKFTYQPDEFCSPYDYARKRPHSPEAITNFKCDPILSEVVAPKRNKECTRDVEPALSIPNEYVDIDDLFSSLYPEPKKDSKEIAYPQVVQLASASEIRDSFPNISLIDNNSRTISYSQEAWLATEELQAQPVNHEFFVYEHIMPDDNLPNFDMFTNGTMQTDSATKLVQDDNSEDEDGSKEDEKPQSESKSPFKVEDNFVTKVIDKNSEGGNTRRNISKKLNQKIRVQCYTGYTPENLPKPKKIAIKPLRNQKSNSLLADDSVETDSVVSTYNVLEEEEALFFGGTLKTVEASDLETYGPLSGEGQIGYSCVPIDHRERLTPVSPHWQDVSNKCPLILPENIRTMEFLCGNIDENSESLENFEFILRLKTDFDINTVDFGGNSVFLIACSRSIKIVRFLLKNRRDLDKELSNLDGDNALLCASRSGRLDIVQLLLEHKFEVNIQNYKTGDTPMHIALYSENLELMKFLIKYGADPLINNFASKSVYDISTMSVNNEVKNYLYIKAQERFGKKPIRIRPPTYESPLNAQLRRLKPLVRDGTASCEISTICAINILQWLFASLRV